MEQPQDIVAIRNEIKTEVMDKKEVLQALASYTFKKLSEANILKALMEGRMRGFTLQDFMVKNVYAIPFGKGDNTTYSLVTSVSHARKTALKGGQTGKSAPAYTYEENEDGTKKVESCSITVWKKGGDERGYTATVYFDEYYKKGTEYNGYYTPSMWDNKPRTMIAKVAEMHALRMAFPEEMSELYLEEEFDKSHVVEVEVNTVDLEAKARTIKSIKSETDLDELQTFFAHLESEFVKDEEVQAAYTEQKQKLSTPVRPAKRGVKKTDV